MNGGQYSNIPIQNNGSQPSYGAKSSSNNGKNNNQNNETNVNSIGIDDALSQSSYLPYYKSFIRELIQDNYYEHQEAKVYFIDYDDEKIFVIYYTLMIPLKDKYYKVNILVYLPKEYPSEKPTFYIHKHPNIGVNRSYTGFIDFDTLQIFVEKHFKFNEKRNNIEEIVQLLKTKFKNEFPIYREKQNTFGFELVEKCTIDWNRVKQVKLVCEKFNDETFLQFMKKQTKDKIRETYFQFSEIFKEIQKDNQNLKNLKNKMNDKMINNNSQINVEKLKEEKKRLIKIKDQLNDIEGNINDEINEMKENNKKSILEKTNEFIRINNEHKMKYIVMKKALEDYLAFLRKGFEKKIISLDEMIGQTRMLSRELFNINYSMNKFE
jgi:hypothetical protein